MQDTALTLRPKKYKWQLSFLISVTLFVFSLSYLSNLGDYYGASGNKGVVFFLSLIIGSVSVYTLFRLLPMSGYLRLNSKGFKWQSIFYGDKYLWKDVANFSVNKFGYVLFDTNSHGREKSLLESKLGGNLKEVRRLFGNKQALPDNYGLQPQELANMLNTWKNRYSEGFKN